VVCRHPDWPSPGQLPGTVAISVLHRPGHGRAVDGAVDTSRQPIGVDRNPTTVPDDAGRRYDPASGDPLPDDPLASDGAHDDPAIDARDDAGYDPVPDEPAGHDVASHEPARHDATDHDPDDAGADTSAGRRGVLTRPGPAIPPARCGPVDPIEPVSRTSG
jgi:hypothetical protein